MSEVALFEEELFDYLHNGFTGSVDLGEYIAGYVPSEDVIMFGFMKRDDYLDGLDELDAIFCF